MTFFVPAWLKATLSRLRSTPASQLRSEPNAFFEAMAAFDDRLAFARRHHQPTRHIEAERRAFTHKAIAG